MSSLVNPKPNTSINQRSTMETLLRDIQNLFSKFRPYLCYILLPATPWALVYLLKSLVPGPQHQAKLKLKDRTVLITGASSGLGRELAIKMYKQGARVIVTARSIDKLKDLCEELKSMEGVDNSNEPVYKYLDMCDPNGLNGLLALVPDKKIDVLVNNAGVSMRGSCKETSMEVHRQLMEVNYFGHVAITKALLDYIPDDGAIVVTSSIQGRIAIPYRCAYSASKHAAQAFFDSLRGESRPNLQILVISAGYMNTGFGSHALTIKGKATGTQDANQSKGLSANEAASQICEALVNRKTELIMAPLHHRLAILLRCIWPDLLFWMNYRRSLKDPVAKNMD